MAIIMNQKNLHKHSLPIVLVVVAIFIGSLAALSQLVPGQPNDLQQVLGARLLTVKVGDHAFVNISIYKVGNGSLQTTSAAGKATVSELTAN